LQKHKLLPPILLLILCLASTQIFSNLQPKQETEHLSPIVEEVSITPTLTISPSPTLTPTPTSTPTPTPTPTKTPTPSPAKSEEINSLIDRFSIQYGIDPNVLRHIAICESGFNSNATNGPYVGLYQFDTTTWQNLRNQIGENNHPNLRYQAKDSIQTAAYALSKNKGRLWPNCLP
jgi:hypothetical protein